ncbi:MAG: binding domain protein [Caulobacteraceae bacterium]|nr:binding domain protein [Caulobacteraceae bacterium]
MGSELKVAIVGGGIAGLAFALNLHRRGIVCDIYEAAPELKELGVGITLLPHAMRELSELGLEKVIQDAGIQTANSAFFNRFGQLIYKEPRGLGGGYAHPEVAINRGKLHMALFAAATAEIGADKIHTDHRCVGVSQSERGVELALQSTLSGLARDPVKADIVVACDGVNSAIRRQYYPGERLAFTGINTWRGVTWRKPILDGRTYMRIGSLLTGKMVVYPIENSTDGSGRQLINWMAERVAPNAEMNDWNTPGRLEDFFPTYSSWTFDWLDVAGMIRDAEQICEYPMVDKDPVDRWTFGRVTLAGDAAHPMYPRGSNGSAQALIDVRVLAELLSTATDAPSALIEYERVRAPATAAVVRTNRSTPPDFINIKVEELVGDRPFDRLDDYISQDELRQISDDYKKVAGFSLNNLSMADAHHGGRK